MKKLLIILIAIIALFPQRVRADEPFKGYATVYSLEGKTKLNTDTRYGICATGKEELLGKYVVIFQRLPDDSKGDCLGIFHVEDTGCKEDVIDIWCPAEWQKMIIDKTYENGCGGKIYIQVVE